MTTPGRIFTRLEAIQQAVAAEDINDAFESAVADFGGTAFSIGVLPNGAMPKVFQERGLARWIGHYHDSGLFTSCAFANRAKHTLMPFTWDEEIALEPDATYEVASAARDYGLYHGLQIPVVMRHGLRGGAFVQTEQELLSSEARQMLYLFALAAYHRLEQVHAAETEPEMLSMREREVLTWFAEGKSAEDVGRILDISPATVMYHYRAVADRYGTLNRTHTIIEAMRRGALQLS